jgi:hypothetical protein
VRKEVDPWNDVPSGWTAFKWALGGIVVLVIGAFAIQGTDFFLYKVFAPKQEAVRRQTFEQSKAYNQGMVQELQNMMFEYVKATPEQQEALGALILHRVADYDVEKLPPDLRDFVVKLRAERLKGKP